jgi:hypothetical protein
VAEYAAAEFAVGVQVDAEYVAGAFGTGDLRLDPLGSCNVKTIDLLLEESGRTIEEIAERSGLPAQRVEAIALGRWTPSPAERLELAEAFEVAIDDIAWGHTMNPRNIRYRRLGLRD